MTSHDLFLNIDGMLATTLVLLSNSMQQMHEVDVVHTGQLCHRCNGDHIAGALCVSCCNPIKTQQ